MSRRSFLAALGMCAVLAITGVPVAQSVVLTSSKDNMLAEHPQGILSNALGNLTAAGRIRAFGSGAIRRGLIMFDVAANVPAGSTIVSVTLTLTIHMVATTVPRDLRLHRLTASWGEGTSFNTGAAGTFATAGDATWLHRFFNTTLWTTPGGDFVASPSATTSVTVIGPYEWSSAQMVADVQTWLDNPASNNGWIVIGDESTTTTAKTIFTREEVTAAFRPRLEIEYAPSCADAAVSSRNAGTNPLSYSATAPELGGVFTATVNNNLAGQTTSRLFAFEAPISFTFVSGQTLLCLDLGSGELFTGSGVAPSSSAGGVDAYSMAVPDLPATCGVRLYTQAIQFGVPPYKLSNAQDLTLGD